MPLTASEHQKIGALQTIANLVGQAQSVSGNQAVLRNVVNNALSQISQWERSDPEFQELAIWLRRARVDSSPHVIMNIAGQAQRMIAMVRGGLPYRTDPQYGLKMQWDPVRGNITSPVFEEDEPITPHSAYGWRGSKKFPFGLPIPQWNVVEGYDLGGYNGIVSTTGSLFTTLFKVVALCSGSILAIHGYEKNNKSLQWGLTWGILGGAAWPVGLFLMFKDGFAGNKPW